MIGYGKPFSYRMVIDREEIEIRVKSYEFISNNLSRDCFASSSGILVYFEIEDGSYVTRSSITIGYNGLDSLYIDIINSIIMHYYDILPQNGTITLNI